MRIEPTAPTYGAPSLELGSLRRDLVAALVSGQFAGLVMLGAMMLSHLLFLSGDAFMPLSIIGSVVTDQQTLRTDVWTTLAGFFAHQLGPTLFWSVVFGVLVHVTKLGEGIGVAALGPMVGLASMLVDVQALLMRAADTPDWVGGILGVRSWIWHLIFGISLCVFPKVRAWLSRRE